MCERPPERDPTQGFGRGSSQGFEGEMVEDSIPKALWKEMRDIGRKRNGQVLQVMGERGEIFPSPSPQLADHINGPLPILLHPRIDFFTDWSSVRSGSSLVRTPLQSISVGERGHKANQITPQPSHPITEQNHMGVAEDTLLENHPTTTPTAQQQLLYRSSVMGERRVNDIRTSTSDVVVELTRDRTRTSNIEANAQTSIPIVDVLLPSGHGDHVIIPHVNLSISGYEPDSLRTCSMRSSSMWAQEVSAIPQVDGPRSLPMRDPIERWMDGIPRLVE